MSTLSRKDFEAIAEVFAEHSDTDEAFYIALDLSDVFYSINPRFDHNTFFNMCGFDYDKFRTHQAIKDFENSLKDN